MAAGPRPIHEAESEGEWSQRDAYWARRRGLQFGVPHTGYRAATAQMSRMEAASAMLLRSRALTGGAPAIPFSWDFIGPLPMFKNQPNFASAFTGAPLANSQGRVSALAADPTTPGRLFVGTAGGGVWMTTDGGNSFTPIFDGQPSLAIGAIALYPKTTPPTIFVGTGEGNGSSDSYYGQGIFMSVDLGASWTPLAPGTFDRVGITRLAVDSNSPPHLFAAVTGANSANRADAGFFETNPANEGLWRSLDGGNTWTQYSVSTFRCLKGSNPCPADDVVIEPNNPKNVFAAIDSFNVYRSTDGGDSWQGMTFPGVISGPGSMGRQSLAVSVSSPGTVYAMHGAAPPPGGNYLGFFRSSDSGANWTAATVPSTRVATCGSDDFTSIDGTSADNYSKSDYDQALAVIPDNAATLYFGGVAPYISKNSGADWSFIAGKTCDTAPSTHADQHAVAVDPFNTDVLYIGNDGGLFSYDLSTGVWTALSFGFSAGQIQGIGPHPWDNAILIAGFQDNGTQLYSGSQGWPVGGGNEEYEGTETGDGGFALYDQIDPTSVYHTFATEGEGLEPVLSTSSDGGGTWNTRHRRRDSGRDGGQQRPRRRHFLSAAGC